MKKPSASVKVDGKWVRRPAPHPPRKRPPKNNLGHIPAMFRAMGPNFYVPGRPLPRPRRPDSSQPPDEPAAPRYMLDTNTCIYMMEGGWPRVTERFSYCRTGEAVMSAVTLAEMRQGVALAKDEKTRQVRDNILRRILQRVPVLPFDAAAANCCEQLGAFVRERKRENDKLIAAHAFQRKLTLVTNDLRHFNRYPGLRLENWT